MMYKKHFVGFALASLGFLSMLPNAWAEESSDPSITSFTTTTSVIMTIGVATPFVMTTTSPMMSSASMRSKNEKAATLYIQRHATALIDNVQMGAGQNINDLAKMMGIPQANWSTFAKRIRASRKQLIPHLMNINQTHARQFWRALFTLNATS